MPIARLSSCTTHPSKAGTPVISTPLKKQAAAHVLSLPLPAAAARCWGRRAAHRAAGSMAAAAAAAPPAQQHQQWTETAVAFAGPGGRRLAGVLTRPAASADAGTQQQAVLLCHGFASHKNGFHLPALAHHLASALGLASLRFDYAGNADSGGPFRFGGFMQEVEQMAAARAYLADAHGMRLVALLGHSRGAINATLFGGRYPCAVPLLVLVAGRLDLTANMTQRYGPDVLQRLRESGPWPQVTRRDGDGQRIDWQLTAQEMQERFELDMRGACGAIRQAHAGAEAGAFAGSSTAQAAPHVLVLHGGADPICEASDAAALAATIGPGARLVVVRGADHWFAGKRDELLREVTAFLAEALAGRVA